MHFLLLNTNPYFPSQTDLSIIYVRSAFLIQISYPVKGVPLSIGATHSNITVLFITVVVGVDGLTGAEAHRIST